MKPHRADQDQEQIVANATSFRVNLFLGTGKYARSDADTLEDANRIAREMLKENPETSRRPMIYAIQADGRFAIVKPKDE